jgi:hypothetical protein
MYKLSVTFWIFLGPGTRRASAGTDAVHPDYGDQGRPADRSGDWSCDHLVDSKHLWRKL